MFNLPSLNKTSCSVPFQPTEDYHGYVGTNTAQGPMLCGGSGYSTENLSDCFLLGKNGTWLKVQSMNRVRMFAAAVETNAGWWVTGAFQVSHIYTL